MTVEELDEFQQLLDQGTRLDAVQCATLLAEVWRLKTVNSSKAIEAQLARDESRRVATALNEARVEIDALRAELKQLKAINGLPECALEARWSNCAVRQKKSANDATHLADRIPQNQKTSDQ
jgi:hypothetical protein